MTHSTLSRIVSSAMAIAALSLAAVVAAQPAAADRPELPVPYTFMSGAVKEITQPGAPLAGANDWSCQTTEAHPRPVVLVHGTFGGGADNWATLGPLLHNEGYCVFTLTYGNHADADWPISAVGGVRSIPDVSVPAVAEFVDSVLAATGADQVDLVGHSQGTLVSGDVAKRQRPGRVGSVVSLAGPWEGTGQGFTERLLEDHTRTSLEGSPLESIPHMLSGSEYLEGLYGTEGTPYAQGVSYTNISTRYDEAVIPFTSGQLPGPDVPGYAVTNIVVQDGCEADWSDHASLPSSPRAADFVLNALDPAHPRTPRCASTAPLHGAIGAVPANPAPPTS